MSVYVFAHAYVCVVCICARECLRVYMFREKTPLSDVSVAEGKSPWDMDVGTPHHEHSLSEQEVAVVRETRSFNEREEKEKNKLMLCHSMCPV